MLDVSRYRAGRDRGVDWLAGQMGTDGRLGPIDQPVCYYRIPWAMAASGRADLGMANLEWIRRHMWDPRSGQMRGISPRGTYDDRYGSYPEACLAFGAQLLRRYDITRPALAYLIGLQNPESGGFFNCWRPTGPEGLEELFPTCQAGMSLLLAGERAAAVRAAEWVARLLTLQPDFPRRLYTVYEHGRGLVTDFPADQAYCFVTDSQAPRQQFYNGGIAAAFLAQLYLNTGDAEYLTLACTYQAFAMNSTPDQFRVAQVCKTGWGAAILYQATGERAYRDWTIRVADYYLSTQAAEGYWDNSPHLDPNRSLHGRVAVTAEFVMQLDTIIGALQI